MNDKNRPNHKNIKGSMMLLQNLFLIVAFLSATVACSSSNSPEDIDFKYIESAEVISPIASKVKVDNFAHFIELDFDKGTDLTNVKIKVTLSAGVSMVTPTETTSTYDLTKDASIKVKKGGTTQSYLIKVKMVNAPFTPSADKWEKKNDYGELPGYISVYKYKQTVAGKNVQAYIAVAEMNNKSVKFKVLGEKTGYKTPTQFYEENSKPVVVLNGGYFWSGTSLGLLIRDGNTISHQQPVTNRDYNGAPTPYYPTQGVFGMDNNKVFSAHYAYESQGVLYTYPKPAPNKAGDKPLQVPTKDFPANAKPWAPVEAIGAGPLLIKDGVYMNLWEAELFDAASGVGPTANHPRSAVAYHPSGHVVFFVCEGRNKTPSTPGLTMKDMADLFLDLGCTDAINLDGGGSSCMLIRGQETIIPSDDGKQRTVTNAIALY